MKKLILSLFAIAITSVAIAQDKPSVFQSRTATMQAVVEEIDHEARLVTVRKPDGSTLTFTPSDEVRNLDQVHAGDVLLAEYTQSVSISVHSPEEGVGPASGEIAGIARTEAGQMPGMAAVDSQITIAEVAEIDLEQNTYKLLFDDGSIQEFVALNPENLRMGAVGDLVVIEVTETLVATVEEISPE